VKVLRLEVGDALKNPGQSYPFEGELTIDRMDVLGDPVSFRDVCVKGRFMGTGDSVAVEARVKSVAVSRCALCLKEVSVPLDAAFRASYKREVARRSRPVSAERPHDRIGRGRAGGASSGTADPLPLQTRCEGLCPVCGENLNDGRCTCRVHKEDPILCRIERFTDS
jgi:uncharacterized protein